LDGPIATPRGKFPCRGRGPANVLIATLSGSIPRRALSEALSGANERQEIVESQEIVEIRLANHVASAPQSHQIFDLLWQSAAGSTIREYYRTLKALGASMTSFHAFLLGIMAALTPSLLLLAVLLWREGIGLADRDEEGAYYRSSYKPHYADFRNPDLTPYQK
jgi:hypothetical protein